ncbi:hypothetical protein PHLCEN_2v2858 [Hermanssonia centrifuga]|uniref:Uncharacterized protein n=1 Tax=Hermanssonia centrifuga TaxID=98765 RepID=A0A2R6RI48_9APHY|nr:hypothetical protein PHLCEN_2v2858 [Hermanssonia centrifuga]
MSDPSDSQMAAQQHELTLTRHYENLLLARESSSMQEDLSNNTTIADSLQRLSESLHALLHSMAGEEPPNHQNEGGIEEAERLLDSLLDNREDWATERESEIARLEQENEQLREMLGIDKATAKTQGWLEDEARELTYTPYVPTTMPQPSPHSTESSPGGQGSGRPTTSPFDHLQELLIQCRVCGEHRGGDLQCLGNGGEGEGHHYGRLRDMPPLFQRGHGKHKWDLT